MRDWSRLLHSIAKLNYEQLVAEGKQKVSSVLNIIEKYSDSDSAPITLVGLAAYAATVDDDLSEKELSLVKEILNISEKDFKGFINQVRKDNSIVNELVEITKCMKREEMDEFSYLLGILFAADGRFSDEELDFFKKLCD